MPTPDTFFAIATTDLPGMTGSTPGTGTVERLRVDAGTILNRTGETYAASNAGSESVTTGDVVLAHVIDCIVFVTRT